MDLTTDRPGRYIGLEPLYQRHRREQFELEIQQLSDILRALTTQGNTGRATIVRAQMQETIHRYQISTRHLVGSNG